MSSTTPTAGEQHLALDSIRVRDNVRELDPDHVNALAQSIKLRGLLVPLIVRPVDDAYELVAGYHRIAADRLAQFHLPSGQQAIAPDGGGRRGTSTRANGVAGNNGFVRPRAPFGPRTTGAANTGPGKPPAAPRTRV